MPSSDRHHARPAHVFGYVIPGFAQMIGKLRRGLRFMRGKFWIAVQIKIERVRVAIDAFHFLRRGSLRAGNGREQDEAREF